MRAMDEIHSLRPFLRNHWLVDHLQDKGYKVNQMRTAPHARHVLEANLSKAFPVRAILMIGSRPTSTCWTSSASTARTRFGPRT